MNVKVDGAALREAREAALLSQRELSEISGVSADTITRLETEEATAYGRTIRRLAAALSLEDYRELLVDKPGKALARQ